MDFDGATGALEPGDHPQRRGLATPRWAEDGHHATLPYIETEVVQGNGVAEGPGQVPSADGESVSR